MYPESRARRGRDARHLDGEGLLHGGGAVRGEHLRAALRRRGLLLGEPRGARLRRLAADQHRRRGRRGDEAGGGEDPPGLMPAARYEVRGDAAWITLDQPERRNALSDALVAELRQHLATALAAPEVRAVVLTGAGPAFCAGADLKSGGIGAADHPVVEVLKTIWEAPKPVVGRINGHAFGGGAGLVAACDLTVAPDSTLFAFSEGRA